MPNVKRAMSNFKWRVALMLSIAVLPAALNAQSLKPAVPLTQQQDELMQKAVALSDAKKFDSAFVVYSEALAVNPDAVELIYELALAYRLAGKRDMAVSTAMRGTQYDSDIWRDFYLMATEVLGEQNHWRTAAEMLEQAIAMRPEESTLLVPLGQAYLNAGRSNDARPYLQKAVEVDPENMAGHASLATAYGRRRYMVPMILAYMRLMELDEKSTMSVSGLQLVLGGCGWDVAARDTTPLQRLFGWRDWGVYANDSRYPSYIEQGVDMSYDEGDFTHASRVFQLAQIRRGGDGYPTNPEKFAAIIDQLVQALPEPRSSGGGFAARYYVPYLKALRAAGHLTAYCYYLLKPVADPAVNRWTGTHSEQMLAYKNWAKTYTWGAGGQ